MTCQELDSFLYPYLDGEFQPDERLEVEAHLSTCAACAQRVHTEAQVQQALRRAARHAVSSTRAPDALRASLQGGLRQEVRRAQQAVWLRASCVMLAVATAGGAWMALRPEAQQRFVDDAAKRHAKRLPVEIADTTPESVEAWFGGKLDHRVSVPRLPNTTLSGARISNVTDRPAAYISYEAQPARADAPPRRIGLFVFDDAQREIKANDLAAAEVDSSHGYNVAVWRDREIVYELVTDLDESDIRKMLADKAAAAADASSAPRVADAPKPQMAPGVAVSPVVHTTAQ
ncbi:transmembrane regulator PrtR [Aggregicoccus sp. 17bor-14]|uniref:zf-HC2 domain-containing protein n=1 Tax=Myxococcaceae TaxID=31 RepID=UPI00129CC635|nr:MULTISPECIES: zf-HC2 domain-containing protein [Myxococcaceae]MBF5044109.1 zf-HC2 domain-containing protein [Simulacricoccus sp. 17bor-14]MRI89859.1 transmembrane regulator PrtR [Aggregicoccus sp. 17bor-14]